MIALLAVILLSVATLATLVVIVWSLVKREPEYVEPEWDNIGEGKNILLIVWRDSNEPYVRFDGSAHELFFERGENGALMLTNGLDEVVETLDEYRIAEKHLQELR